MSTGRQATLIFLLAVAVLFPGIWEATGLTGKDEFFLGLRTPMEMLAHDHWLVPFLDGVPRIRKPPLLYWLGRVSYETFGVSLTSARLVGILFAATLVATTAAIARRLSGKPGTAWVAAAILLGCMGMATESRRFMLDVPVAALSTAAFWAFLVWLDGKRVLWLTLATLLLAAGFLTKGPIVAMVFGGGVLALLFGRKLTLAELRANALLLIGHGLLWAALALPWFWVVRQLYPEAVSLVLADELESRQFFKLSPDIFLGLITIALPWGFVFLVAAWQQRSSARFRLLLVWFLLTFLPFLLVKTFDRYLIGSLVPMAILLSMALPELSARWPFRLGASLALLFGSVLAGFAFWFGLGGWYWLVVPALYLGWAWWRRSSLLHTLAAPAVFWMALLWGVFPALGVNAVPESVVELGRRQAVAMYDGPQPAMLPILSGQPHRHYGRLEPAALGELMAQQMPVFVEEKDLANFRQDVAAAGLSAAELGSYLTLASHGSGLRFARIGAKSADWQEAFRQRSLAPLLTRVHWFEIRTP
ncbi:ArnT family glycosyltransferase [Rhodocyclus purpureus]|uniref:ArnT family glycosyltransferase n=1 Tax=Rhodocyclus purpureus TaxID=1067 RepID=UPI001911FDC3|nr:glycosyltransferase family 39 protein [Rhodocyclus purpureus]